MPLFIPSGFISHGRAIIDHGTKRQRVEGMQEKSNNEIREETKQPEVRLQ